ncbi:MAG: hypothetical protein PVH88_08470 [Ignavibacteria bacterium]|jgi:hypothetical protein
MRIKLLVFPLLMLYLITCRDEITQPPVSSDATSLEYNFKIKAYPDAGSVFTDFKFAIEETENREFKSKQYKIELDLDNDGVYDKKFDNVDSIITKIQVLWANKIQAKLTFGNDEFYCSTEVFVTYLERILYGQGMTIFEPHIYNSQKIIITWGGSESNGRYALHMLNFDGTGDNCIFCSNENIHTHEMHCSQLSFDNNRIFWNASSRLYFYDFLIGEEEVIEFYYSHYYEPGRICWGLDNNKIFLIDDDGEGVNYIDVENNFDLYSVTAFGEFLCAVPGNEDLIAIMEKAAETDSVIYSNLYYYSLSQSKVVEEFKEIAGFNSFRVIDEGKKIFIEDPLLIYDLYKDKYYYIWFDDIDLSNHQVGETDITMEGYRAIISVHSDDTLEDGLWTFYLPIGLM